MKMKDLWIEHRNEPMITSFTQELRNFLGPCASHFRDDPAKDYPSCFFSGIVVLSSLAIELMINLGES